MNDYTGVSPPRGRHRGTRLLATLVLTTVTVFDYLAWLGWDHKKDVHSDGSETGPYQPWQVVGLVAVLAVVGLAAVWRGHGLATVFGVTAGLTSAVALDWSAADDSGLWALGVAMVFVGTLTVSALAVGLITLVRRSVRPPGQPSTAGGL